VAKLKEGEEDLVMDLYDNEVMEGVNSRIEVLRIYRVVQENRVT